MHPVWYSSSVFRLPSFSGALARYTCIGWFPVLRTMKRSCEVGSTISVSELAFPAWSGNLKSNRSTPRSFFPQPEG